MRFGALSFFTFLLSLAIQDATAIYADEAYQLDFHHSLLGPPQTHKTFFHRPSANSRATLLYTLSERNVLGAVNPKDGALVWRQVLDEEYAPGGARGLVKVGEDADTIFSAVNEQIQARNALDGRLVWQSTEKGSIQALEVARVSERTSDVIVSSSDSTDSVVKKLSGDTGEEVWAQKISGSETYSLIRSGDSIFCLLLHTGLLGSHKIQLQELDLTTGRVLGQPSLPTDNEVSSRNSILYAGSAGGIPLLLWTDKSLKSVKAHVLGTKQLKTIPVPSADGKQADKITVHASGSDKAKPHFLVHYEASTSHGAEVYHIDPKELSISKSFDLPSSNGKGVFSVSVHGSQVYFTRQVGEQRTLFSSMDSKPLEIKKNSSKVEIPPLKPKEPLHMASEVLPLGGATYSVRTAALMPSGDWELTRNGETLWSRPENITDVSRAVFVEFSTDEAFDDLVLESQKNLAAAYVHRVKRHLKDLQGLPQWISTLYKRYLVIINGRPGSDESLKHSDDGSGFNKAIVVATRNGRMAALDCADHGKVLWNIEAVNMTHGQQWDVLSIEAEDDGKVLVRAAGGEYVRVSLADGSILAYQAGGLISSLKTTVPFLNREDKKIVVPVRNDGSLGHMQGEEFNDTNTMVTKGDDGILRGWALGKGVYPVLAWTFMPEPDEQIISASPRPAHDPVASIGKALGDRNVLYKYLNPNVLLVTVVRAKDRVVTFHVIDSISGNILHTTTHSDVDTSQPIRSTIVENWFVYSLFGTLTAHSSDPARPERRKLRGFQLVVSEMFESSIPNDRGPLGNTPNVSSSRPLLVENGRLPDYPHVMSQTFLIPGPISYMTTTSTLQGITPRSLLCGLPRSNSLISIPRYMLDPRRPVGRDPTALEAEEGLYRYNLMLDFDPKWVLSHKLELRDISSIVATPSNLESTSLVFAFGDLDLFGTRVAPIGAFDMLGKGFSQWQLVATVVALAVGTSLLAPFARRKQIDGHWKT